MVVEVLRLSRHTSPVHLVIRSPQALVCQSSSLTHHIREESSWHQSNCVDVMWLTFSATQHINKQTEVCECVWNAVGPVVVTSWSWFGSWEVPVSDVWNISSANTHHGFAHAEHDCRFRDATDETLKCLSRFWSFLFMLQVFLGSLVSVIVVRWRCSWSSCGALLDLPVIFVWKLFFSRSSGELSFLRQESGTRVPPTLRHNKDVII